MTDSGISNYKGLYSLTGDAISPVYFIFSDLGD